MPYIGNAPTTQFASLDYQDLTGVTGVPAKRGYTLNSAVGSANDIEVFVNNVRQEPGIAYTVSGTTLTMTGDVETTDDFYVVFQGKAVGTASHPAGNALEATSGTFTGNVSITGTTSSTGAITATAGIILPSGQGIDFSATSDGSATTQSELLDDYEEGTWTPIYGGVTSNPTVTYTSQTGATYTKIGRIVYITGRIRTSAASGGSGNLTIEGLPFALSTGVDGDGNSQETSGCIPITQAEGFSSVNPKVIEVSTANMVLFTAGGSNFQTSDLNTVLTTANLSASGNNRIRFAGFYITDS